ncbi:MAG: hypothetical protein ACE5JD_12010 [Candidatus Methylomirabilia bacterium]
MSWQWRTGFDLRSRCLLVPQHGLRIELLSLDRPQIFSLQPDNAVELLRAGALNAAKVGLKWNEQPITLYPGKELAKAVQMSHRLEGRA